MVKEGSFLLPPKHDEDCWSKNPCPLKSTCADVEIKWIRPFLNHNSHEEIEQQIIAGTQRWLLNLTTLLKTGPRSLSVRGSNPSEGGAPYSCPFPLSEGVDWPHVIGFRLTKHLSPSVPSLESYLNSLCFLTIGNLGWKILCRHNLYI